MLIAADAWSDATVRPVHTLATSNAINVMTVNPTATATHLVSVLSAGEVDRSCDRRRLPRRTATTRAASTATNTATQTDSMSSHNV
jgi:hypothetical protein